MKKYLLLLLLPIALQAQDPIKGEIVWKTACIGCHTGAKGWDLAHFQFQDSTILRRAILHVPLVDAQNVVAHINSLNVADTMTNKSRPFQPKGIVLASDSIFGVTMFGIDQWPTTVTRDQLKLQDPTQIPISLPLLVWADETSPADWLPGTGQGLESLPPGVKAATKIWLDKYYANPSVTTAVNVAKRLHTVSADPTVVDAPCLYTIPLRYDPQVCADAGKWGAVLIYTEGVRNGRLNETIRIAADEFWETGHLFHKAQQFHRPMLQRDYQIAAWMHLGWMWARSLNKKAGYETGPLHALAMDRQATWVVLRTTVDRINRSIDNCTDAVDLAGNGSVKWMVNAMTFMYHELQYKDANNLLPADRAACIKLINTAQNNLRLRGGTYLQGRMQPLADSTKLIIAN